jgi:hypothetical protein
LPYYPRAIESAVASSIDAPENEAVETDVALPFTSKVITGIAVADPYDAAVTPVDASVNASAVVPDPVASPDAVIVWFAVKKVEVSISYVSEPVLLINPVSESGMSVWKKAPAALTLVASVTSADDSIAFNLV